MTSSPSATSSPPASTTTPTTTTSSTLSPTSDPERSPEPSNSSVLGKPLAASEAPASQLNCLWGVDYSTKGVWIGSDFPDLSPTAECAMVPEAVINPLPARLAALHHITLKLAARLAFAEPAPDLVAVEIASATSRSLRQANGVIIAALQVALNIDRNPRFPVSIIDVGQSTWQRRVLGKLPRGADRKQLSVEAAAKRGFTAPSHDHADAANIAHYLRLAAQ